MRILARFEERSQAETLHAALVVEGIEGRVEPAKEGGFHVWVHDERDLDRAKFMLRAYEEKPDDPRFEDARKRAPAVRREKAKEEKSTRPNVIDPRRRWTAVEPGIGYVTLFLIGVCSIAFLISFPGVPEMMGSTRQQVEDWFLIDRSSSYDEILRGKFYDVRQGQVWRLVSPIFMHAEPKLADGMFAFLMGVFHFIFNVYWLRDLGTRIEHRQSAFFMIGIVLVTAILSNVAQYLLVGPNFYGMSGVVYGLFGYVWIRGYFDPASGYGMPGGTVALMIGWMIAGFFGLLNMANWAHAGGLLVGAVWGFFASGVLKRWFSS
jgi:GlpG protein